MKSYFDCVVIGAGVAGMTAAIYLKRYNINILLLEKAAYGGQINQTLAIENYPGFSIIDGPTLSENIYSQIKALEIPYQYGNVIDIKKHQNDFIITTEEEEIKCKSIILATGRNPRKLELEHENELIGRGISWCATCDGMFYKNKEVIVVGGGNSALEEAYYLSSICTKVTIIHRRNQFRADEMIQEKINQKSNIETIYDSQVTNLNITDGLLTSVEITNGKTNITQTIPTSALFIYIGFTPDINYLKNLEIKTNNGYIVVDQTMKTSVDGLFACGDMIDKDVYQIVTATGEASIAATSVKNYCQGI